MTPFQTIGIVHSCFKEKFGIPRQPRMIPEATGVLKLLDLPEMRDAVRGLEEFSHVWVIYIFHGHKPANDWKSLIRPPRLGGTKKVGVFASRSPHRPNPIGISALKLERIDLAAAGGIELHLSGLDLLDQTPVIDIKPYVSYADSIPEAETSWATDPPRQLPVEFSPEALSECERITHEEIPGFDQLVKKMIALDPRPAFQAQRGAKGPQTAEQSYAARIHHFDVHWTLESQGPQATSQEATSNERCRVTRILVS
ncbi:MAG TPA: tRNA (N6-threonylcarbamoyladenosine(37)-N6)-methyltransferase TrmO [Bdellovibrionota bacterium]|nr:tRNA (N6-threonylcarbamoyladenosine(37)-N6)-methyltransferase TrmO [Bdellovibrionota bacterium]